MLHTGYISLSRLGPPEFHHFSGVNWFSVSKAALVGSTRCSTEFIYVLLMKRSGWDVTSGL